MKNLVTLLFLVFSFTLGTAQSKALHSQGVKKETKKKHHSKQKSSATYSSQKLKKDGTRALIFYSGLIMVLNDVIAIYGGKNEKK